MFKDFQYFTKNNHQANLETFSNIYGNMIFKTPIPRSASKTYFIFPQKHIFPKYVTFKVVKPSFYVTIRKMREGRCFFPRTVKGVKSICNSPIKE